MRRTRGPEEEPARAQRDPVRPPPERESHSPLEPLTDIQRSAGNEVVDHLLNRPPPSGLVVGSVDDPAERQADRVAETVLERLREPEPDSSEVDFGAARATTVARAPGGLPSEPVIGAEGGPLTPDLNFEIEIQRHRGQPLAPDVRRRMESAFGTDLGAIRVHTGPEAAALNRALAARAFTTGADIFFGEGRYAPGSAEGDGVLAHELVHTIQQAPTVQRLMDRQDLERLAGAPKTPGKTRRLGVEYRAVLDLLDQYHQQADALILGQPLTTPQAIHAPLIGLLDQLKTACWNYIEARREENPERAAIIEQELLVKEIPRERRRLDSFIRSEGYAPLAGGKSVSEAMAEPVKVSDVTIGVDNAVGGSGQRGHSMDIAVELDAGTRPQTPPGAPPHSIYGVQLEYWEKVDDLWDFQDDDPVSAADTMADNNPTGKDTKQWNDIYAIKPDASTFQTNNVPGSDINWKAAVTAATAGTLRGRHKIGFTDYPGIWIKPHRYYKRVLRFRIVIRDGAQQREIYATQVLDQQDGELGYSAYSDNRGNHLEAANYSGPGYANRDIAQEQLDITAYGDRLGAGGFGSPADLASEVPDEGFAAIRAFVNHILAPPTHLDAAFGPFDYKEKRKYLAASGADDDVWEDIVRPRAVAAAGNTAGTFLPPAITGQAHQWTLPSGHGLLVAIMHGNAIWKMYYTTVATQQLNVQLMPNDPDSVRQLKLRRYHEIPMEMVEPWVKVAKAPNPQDLNAAIEAEQEALTEGDRLAAKINGLVAADDAGRIVGTVRDNHNFYDAMAAAYANAKATTATTLAAADLDTFMVDHLKGLVRDNKNTVWNFHRLSVLYRGPRLQALVKRAIAEKKPHRDVPTLVAGVNPDVWALEQIIRDNEADPQELRDELMDYVRAQKGSMQAVEVDYRTAIANLTGAGDMPVGWTNRVPADFGPLSYEYFLDQFRRDGGGLVEYRQLMADFPGLDHRIKPAYRFLFGDKELQQMVSQLRSATMLAKYDPSDPDNLDAKFSFLQHAPFTVQNFEPSTDAGKFDAEYDPKTGRLRIIVKVAFEFAASDMTQLGTKTKIKNKEVHSRFAKSTWANSKAKNAAKAQFRAQVLGIWSSQLRPIVCTRPGWEDIKALPFIDIEEVGAAQAHHKIRITKAVLTNVVRDMPNAAGDALVPTKIKGLRSTGTSGYAEVLTGLKEYDVTDKINDPAVHRQLHQIEKTGNIDPAYNLDRTRQQNILGRYGTLAFQAGDVGNLAQPARLKVLIEELKRLDAASSLSYLHPLQIEGHDAANDVNRAGQRAAHVAGLLKRAGILNPIHEAAGAGGADHVVVGAGAADPQVLQTYVDRWSRISAAHEFGHMLGLIDEYYKAQTNDTVRQMIRDGFLPPDTPADHFTSEQMSGWPEAEGQQATAALLELNDLMTPDFTTADQAKSTSLMTGGTEVTAQHMITMWEVLAHMTSTDLGGRHWRIG